MTLLITLFDISELTNHGFKPLGEQICIVTNKVELSDKSHRLDNVDLIKRKEMTL